MEIKEKTNTLESLLYNYGTIIGINVKLAKYNNYLGTITDTLFEGHLFMLGLKENEHFMKCHVEYLDVEDNQLILGIDVD